MYEDAPVLAAQETSIDFSVDAVAVAATEVGVLKVTGGAITDTAVAVLFVVPLPSCPERLSPQHLIVVSVSNAHVCEFPAEICATPLTPLTAIGIG